MIGQKEHEHLVLYEKSFDLDLICFLINGILFMILWVVGCPFLSMWFLIFQNWPWCDVCRIHNIWAAGWRWAGRQIWWVTLHSTAWLCGVHPLIFWYRLTGWGEVRQCAIGSLANLALVYVCSVGPAWVCRPTSFKFCPSIKHCMPICSFAHLYPFQIADIKFWKVFKKIWMVKTFSNTRDVMRQWFAVRNFSFWSNDQGRENNNFG